MNKLFSTHRQRLAELSFIVYYPLYTRMTIPFVMSLRYERRTMMAVGKKEANNQVNNATQFDRLQLVVFWRGLQARSSALIMFTNFVILLLTHSYVLCSLPL